MTVSSPRVVVTRRLPADVEARLRDLFAADLNLTDTPMSQAELMAAAAEADVLAPTVTDRIDAAVIAAGTAGRLKLIANFGAGTDHIDLAAAHARGLTVTNTPGALTEDTADMTMALILAAFRRLGEGAGVMRAGGFSGWSPTWMLGRSVHGKALGIIGLGRIGQALARRARAFEMAIHYHNRRPVSPAIEADLGATYWPSLDQMLARVDVVSVNCPRTPATFHLLSARRLKLLRPEAYVVNTARGDVIDEAALADLLAAGKIAGAALDVFEHEPAVDPRLLTLPNVLLTPHMSSATTEARIAMGERMIINIRVWQSGDRPPDRVLPEAVLGA